MTQISKWELLSAAEAAREPMGLKRTSLDVLRAMISLVGSEQINDTQPDHHICFASNATLAERTYVSEKTIERHLSALAELGLIRRITKGNGKRWARRGKNGAVQLASGISLLPLVEKHNELKRAGEAHAAANQRMKLIKDRCGLVLQQIRAAVSDCPQIDELWANAARTLRRKPCLSALEDLLSKLTSTMADLGLVDNTRETDKMRDTTPQSEGHKETNNNPIVKRNEISEVEVSSEEIERSFPYLCKELRTVRSHREGQNKLANLARDLGIGREWNDIRQNLGHQPSYMLIGYALQRITKIENPRAYILSLYKRVQSGQMAVASLLKPQTGRAGGLAA